MAYDIRELDLVTQEIPSSPVFLCTVQPNVPLISWDLRERMFSLMEIMSLTE